MSSDFAIRVEGLGKCYSIYQRPEDRLKQAILPRLQRLARREPGTYFREHWALRDVSFEVARGETVGIIGRNGSGKSTLLQMICGTMSPTCGTVKTNGRIAALLELGSGFNPEFTGRENVYLYASILGLTNEEIDARIGDINAFADIGDFVEQPVKTYSSGMVVRLAFAVIAHVDADILVIDEALAVGDAFFVQKCMRFLRKFMERGTVLFVSHDTGAVINLCQRAVWLHKGRLVASGPPNDLANDYLANNLQDLYGDRIALRSNRPTMDGVDSADANSSASFDAERANVTVVANLSNSTGWRTGEAELTGIEISAHNADASGVLQGGERVELVIKARALQALDRPILGFLLKDRLGQTLFGENTLGFTATHPMSVEAGQSFCGRFVFRLPLLPDGQYSVMASVANGDLHNNIQHHYAHEALILHVASSKVRWGLVGIPFEKACLECTA